MKFLRLEPPPVIAGWGVVTPLGIGCGPVLDRTDGEAPAAVMADLPTACGESPLRFRRMDRYGALGFAAARLALRSAGRGSTCPGDPAWGILFGSSLGSWSSTIEYARGLASHPASDAGPAVFARTVSNAINGEVSIAEQLGGESETLVSGWAAGAEAIAEAASWIVTGRARWMIAGGVEAPDAASGQIQSAEREFDAPWLPSRLAEGAAACVLVEAAEMEPGRRLARVVAYWRGYDGRRELSVADAVAALPEHDFAHVVIANTMPPEVARRAQECGKRLLHLSNRTGELGAANGALGVAVAAGLLEREPHPRSALVVARGSEGDTVALAVSCAP